MSSDEEMVRYISPQHLDHGGGADWDDPGSLGETEVSHSESDWEVSRNSVWAPGAKPRSNTKPYRELREKTTQKRQVKPVLSLTYGEPGKVSNQPIRIVP